jgi:hypothetical protein
VQLTDAGAYAVLVTNAAGFALSSNALLVVYAPDHFAWDPIPSPRFVNVPFMVRIEAQDANNQAETNFHGIVFFQSTIGVPIQPTTSSNFVQGVWNGLVRVSGVASNVVLLAEDGFGHAGFANPINVIKLPQLTLQHISRTILISWPSEASGFVLESSPQLSPASWSEVSGSVAIFNGTYQIRVQTSATNSFYRLRLVDP